MNIYQQICTQAPEATQHPGGFEQVLGQLQLSSSGHTHARVVALIGCQSGDGTSFVLRSLAAVLAERTEKRVLRATAVDLCRTSDGTSGLLLDSCKKDEIEHLYCFDPPKEPIQIDSVYSARTSGLEGVLDLLASHFRYILLDCGAVAVSGHLWTFAPFIDEALLVVAEGETKLNQITYAQRMIQQSGIHLTGCILNKRTYPVPKRLYRFLA